MTREFRFTSIVHVRRPTEVISLVDKARILSNEILTRSKHCSTKHVTHQGHWFIGSQQEPRNSKHNINFLRRDLKKKNIIHVLTHMF